MNKMKIINNAKFTSKNSNKNKGENWFLVEVKNDKTKYIVDYKILELVFSKYDFTFQDFSNGVFAVCLGGHLERDNNFYKRLKLSDYAKFYYSKLSVQDKNAVLKFVEAMAKEEKNKSEHMCLCDYQFKLVKSGIKKICIYNEKQFEQNCFCK